MKFKWRFDHKSQTLITEAGHPITVKEIARWLQDTVETHHDLKGPWTGWRIRGKTLRGPGGQTYTADSLKVTR